MRNPIISLVTGLALVTALAAPVAAQIYPVKNAPTLTYWMAPNVNWNAQFKSFGDTPFCQELSKRTGIPLSFVHPSPTNVNQSFNLMLASGELTDLIEFDFISNVPGGPEKAIKDGYILKLNDAMKKWAPNLMAYLKSHPEVDKMVKLDDGSYYGFPSLRGDDGLMVFQGPILRADWLEDLGLKVPETIDEWTVVLKAFKEKKGATAPFTMAPYWGPAFGDWMSPAFSGAYGAIKDWYIEDGKVHFGPAEPQYASFVKLFADWYKAGLIDANIALTDAKTRDANFVAGKSGATVGNLGGGIGYLAKLMADKDPKARFVAAPYPVLKKGDKAKFGQRDQAFTKLVVAISAKTKNLEAAVRFLDYGYSAEGALFYNFGTPGVSYNLVGGYPTYSELILKNPKLSMAEAMGGQIRGNSGGPFIQDLRYLEQYLALPEQKAGVKVWANTDQAKYNMPLVSPSEADANEMAKIMSEVNTYVGEGFTKMVIGAQPVSDMDKYFAILKKLKIDQAIAIKQRAYDAFLKR